MKKEKYFKNLFKISIILLLEILVVLYTYYFRILTDDELYNYGFATNILNGLIPYKDFNMIITPLFPYLLSIILSIFGKKLIIYHIFIAILIVGITLISYKKIGKNALFIYLLLFIYPYIGYNIFCLFLLFLLISIISKEKNEIIEAIIISLMSLTKQVMIILMIPSIIHAKSKRKVLFVYLISFLILLLYLILNNNLFEFFDYCLLGMFDFSIKNNTGINSFLILEIVLLIILLTSYIKTKRKDILYILLFQIITFPIVDYFHFIISFIPIVYLLLLKFKDFKYLFGICLPIIVCLLTFYNASYIIANDNYKIVSNYKIDNFMKNRMVPNTTQNYIKDIGKIIKNNSDKKIYILGNFSYLIKLNNNMPISKYDIINNGNLGYKGSSKYIVEIENSCKDIECIFIVDDYGIYTNKSLQTNKDILNFIDKNYYKKYSSNIYSIYVNDYQMNYN